MTVDDWYVEERMSQLRLDHADEIAAEERERDRRVNLAVARDNFAQDQKVRLQMRSRTPGCIRCEINARHRCDKEATA